MKESNQKEKRLETFDLLLLNFYWEEQPLQLRITGMTFLDFREKQIQ
jgi:hypothetical protein